MISAWKAALLILVEGAALIWAAFWYYQRPSLYIRTVAMSTATGVGTSTAVASVRGVPSQLPSVPNQSLAHPWLATPVALGAILVDRHLHKNGGSTMRTILHANERAGVCQYWGYWQTWYGWTNFTRELETRVLDRPPASALPRSLPWVCVEAHASQLTFNFMPDVVPLLARLRESFELSRVPIRVLLVTRVREPFSFYLSYFKWKVAGLQRAQRRNRWGRTFAEWAPHNLQAYSMLRGGIDEISGPLYMDRRLEGERFGALEMAELRAGLRAFDIVAPLRFFDEHLLMIADAVGLPHLGYRPISPPQLGMETPLTDASVCPNITACRALIRQIAPWDHVMYREASVRFRASLAAQPPAFHQRLALFRAARLASNAPVVASSCCARRIKCHDKQADTWLAHPPACVPGWDAQQRVIVDDMGACLIASAAAYAPSAFVARRVNACSASMSCAAVAPAPSPLEAGAASLAGALAGLVGDLADRVGEFKLPNVLMAIPGRKGPSNKARAGVSGFFARKLTKKGQKVLRNRRAKGRKYIIPSPGRNAIHGL